MSRRDAGFISNAQLKALLPSFGATDTQADLAHFGQQRGREGEQTICGFEVHIDYERPPIPGADGWYWSREEEALCGPFSTIDLAYDDAVETLSDD